MSQLPAAPTQRSPIAELLILAAPSVAQMLSYTLMQFIDTWMLARVSPVAATAGANSGLLAFAFISLAMGVLMIVNTLVSQNYGRGAPADLIACGPCLWQGWWFSLFFSLLCAATIPWANTIFSAMKHTPELVGMEAGDFRIMIAMTLLKLVGMAAGQFLLGINRPRDLAVASTLGVAVNIVAAWGLIFGSAGLPRLGVLGSAWGQTVGTTVETSILLASVLAPSVRKRFAVMDWPIRISLMRTLLRIGIPSGAQAVCDVLAWAIFCLAVMGRFGTSAMAANTYMLRFMVVSFMPAIGIGSAVTALVGRYIGAGRPDIARQRTALAFRLTAAYMLACAMLFLLLRRQLIGLFSDDPQIVALGSTLLIFAAAYQFFDALYIIYISALRGAGDTLVPALAMAGLCWGVSVLSGYWMATHFPQLGPAGPWWAATAYGIILGLFMYLRFKAGRWESIRLDPASPSAVFGGTVDPLHGN